MPSKKQRRFMRKYRFNKFVSKITSTFRNFWWNIKNIIRWLPILWNNWDWDDGFLFEILEFKLKNMKEYFDTHNIVVASPKIAKEIGIAINLIDRIRKDDYASSLYEEHDKKYGKLRMDLIPASREGYKTAKFSRDNVDPNNEKLVKQEIKDRDRLVRHAHYMMEQDMDYLFKHMRKHVRGWWD